MSDKKNILKKLHAIMSELNYIQKDKRVEFGSTRYNYASEKAIKEAVHPLLVQHQVLPIPSIRSEDFTETKLDTFNQQGTITGQKLSRLSRVRLVVTFYDMESGESLECEAVGYGDDPLDKSPYKAITGALKYILTTMFLIPTGDDPEGGEEVKQETKKAKPNVTEDGKVDHTRAAGQDKKTELMTRLHKALATRKDDGTELFNQGQRAIRVQTAGKKPTIADLTLYVEDVEREAELKELK